METHPVWLASHVALWLLMLVQAFLLFAVMRQIGIIHIRLASSQGNAGSIDIGLPLHSKAPRLSVRGLTGKPIDLADLGGKNVLLTFVNPNCASCHDVIPALKKLQHELSDRLQVVLISSGDAEANYEKLVARYNLVDSGILLGLEESPNTVRLYEVTGTPFAFLLNRKDVIQAKGIPSPEFLERLKVQLTTSEASTGGTHDDRQRTQPEPGRQPTA